MEGGGGGGAARRRTRGRPAPPPRARRLQQRLARRATAKAPTELLARVGGGGPAATRSCWGAAARAGCGGWCRRRRRWASTGGRPRARLGGLQRGGGRRLEPADDGADEAELLPRRSARRCAGRCGRGTRWTTWRWRSTRSSSRRTGASPTACCVVPSLLVDVAACATKKAKVGALRALLDRWAALLQKFVQSAGEQSALVEAVVESCATPTRSSRSSTTRSSCSTTATRKLQEEAILAGPARAEGGGGRLGGGGGGGLEGRLLKQADGLLTWLREADEDDDESEEEARGVRSEERGARRSEGARGARAQGAGRIARARAPSSFSLDTHGGERDGRGPLGAASRCGALWRPPPPCSRALGAASIAAKARLLLPPSLTKPGIGAVSCQHTWACTVSTTAPHPPVIIVPRCVCRLSHIMHTIMRQEACGACVSACVHLACPELHMFSRFTRMHACQSTVSFVRRRPRSLGTAQRWVALCPSSRGPLRSPLSRQPWCAPLHLPAQARGAGPDQRRPSSQRVPSRRHEAADAAAPWSQTALRLRSSVHSASESALPAVPLPCGARSGRCRVAALHVPF